MRCLVTGGAGFLGSHMAVRLRSEGHIVRLLDNFGLLDTVSYRGDTSFGKDWALTSHDIREPIDFPEVDWVFHFAGLAAIPPSFENPAKYMAVNVQGTANVLEAARKAGARRFLYAASGTCYGGTPPMPTAESHATPDGLLSPYALSKWMGEELVRHWDRVFDLPSVSLRLFSPFGERMGLTSAFGHFLERRRKGLPIEITGDGEQFRDMHYVGDMVEAFLLAAQSDIRDIAINIGSGKPVTINQVVKAMGVTDIRYIPARKEASGTHADISLAKRLLGWEPTVSFEEGIRRTLAG